MVSPEVIVVGGGLAGIAAAIQLHKSGRRVLLLEKSSFFGGRAGSTAGGAHAELDVGHHVYLGCCRSLRALFQELGVESMAPLSRRMDLTLIDLGTHGRPAREARLAAWRLPYPLSLIGAIVGYAHLSAPERLDALRIAALASLAHRSKKARPKLEQMSFLEWLNRHRVRPGAVRGLWQPLIVATLNASVDSVSAKAGVMVIGEGLAGGPQSAAVGLFRAPMGSLFQSVKRLLSPRSRALLRRPVRRLIIENGRAKGVMLADDTEIRSEAVVVAVSHVHLSALLPGAWADDPYFMQISRLPTRPIVNVHLWYDRPVAPKSMTGALDSPLQWVFDVSALHKDTAGRPGTTHYCISISDPGEYMKYPQSALVDALDKEMRRAFPAAQNARLIEGRVRKVRHATFLCAPGTERLRPANGTPVRGLFLAGDYTNTGWPSTMESAVISGRDAASLALQSLQDK